MGNPSEVLHFPLHLGHSPATYFSRETFSNPPFNCFYKSFRLWCRSLPSLLFTAPKALTPATSQHHARLAFPRRSAPLSPFGSQFSGAHRTWCKGPRLQSRSARWLWFSRPERCHPVRGQIRKCSTLETFDACIYLPGPEPAPAGKHILLLPRLNVADESRPQDLPPACPQYGSSPTSEDCLYMVVYVPNSIGAGSNAPSLFWFAFHPLSLILPAHSFFFLRIPGGSFKSGSASDPSINGANLASATQSIVAVVQSRLGGVRFHSLLRSFPC